MTVQPAEGQQSREASTITRQPSIASPGDVLQCTNGACGRRFSATRALALDRPGGIPCPACGSPVTIQLATEQGVGGEPETSGQAVASSSPASAGSIASFLDEQLPPNSPARNRLAELLRIEKSGRELDRRLRNEKQLLIYQCLKECSTFCPSCGSQIRAGDKSCPACRLRFDGGGQLPMTVKKGVMEQYAECLMDKARGDIEKAEKRARKPRTDGTKVVDTILAADEVIDLISALLGG